MRYLNYKRSNQTLKIMNGNLMKILIQMKTKVKDVKIVNREQKKSKE